MLSNCGAGDDLILESPLDFKEIKPVHPKGNQLWKFIGRTDAEAGKDWGQEEKRAAKDEMVRYHHQLNGPEYKQTPGDSEGQRSLVCCSPWGCKESDMTEWLNWTGGSVSKEISLQCRRPGFDAWVGKIPCIRGEFHGQRNVVVYRSRGRKKLDMT